VKTVREPATSGVNPVCQWQYHYRRIQIVNRIHKLFAKSILADQVNNAIHISNLCDYTLFRPLEKGAVVSAVVPLFQVQSAAYCCIRLN
jgi:hypothetical protein